MIGVLACAAPRPGDSHRGGQEEERGTRTHANQQASRRSRRGLGSGGLSGGARGWLLGLRGRGCDGEGIDGGGQVNEGPDGAPLEIKERLLGVALQERLIRRWQSVAFVRPPLTIRQVTNKEGIIQVRYPGLGIAMGVIDRGEPESLSIFLCMGVRGRG